MGMTIGKKFLGVIAVLVLFLLGLSVFFLGRLNQATAELEGMYRTDFQNAALVAEVDGLLTRVDINILRRIAIGNPAAVAG